MFSDKEQDISNRPIKNLSGTSLINESRYIQPDILEILVPDAINNDSENMIRSKKNKTNIQNNTDTSDSQVSGITGQF